MQMEYAPDRNNYWDAIFKQYVMCDAGTRFIGGTNPGLDSAKSCSILANFKNLHCGTE